MNIQDRNDLLHQTLKARDDKIAELNAVIEYLEMTRIVPDDSAWKVLVGGMVIVFLTVLGTLWFKG